MANAEFWYVDDYVQALDGGQEHRCSGADTRHVLEVIMSVFESGLSGHTVQLPQQRRDHPLLRARAAAGLGPLDVQPRPYHQWLAAQAAKYGWRHERTGLYTSACEP